MRCDSLHSAPMDLGTISNAAAAAGLICRGGFHAGPDDGVPGNAATVVLLGNAGPGMWAAFTADGGHKAPGPDRLDDWVRRVVTEMAQDLGARALFPFHVPYLPFQRWARKCEPVHPSPIGPLIHPRFGLWHAYRAALAFNKVLDLPPFEPTPSPCETCPDKPCLGACPVDAFQATGETVYDVPACVAHLRAAEGVDCLGTGCLARRACPVGTEYQYAPDQARLHMEGFVRAQRA